VSEFNLAKSEQPARSDPNFSPVNDLFAPFFDAVFYRPSETQGIVENPQEQAQISPFVDSIFAEETSSAFDSVADIAARQGIGGSTIQLRSVGGGLQTFDQAGPDSPLGQLVNYRANLQVTMLSAAALQATITLTPPYEDALRIIDSQAIKFGSLMELQWGYLSTDGAGKPAISDKGLFRITQPSIKFGREITITIGGFDILSSALSAADVRCCWPRATYECDLKILQDLIKKRAPDGIKLNTANVGDESPLRKKKERDVIQSDSDWTFFRRLCRQNDVAFSQVGSDIFLRDESRIDIAKPKYRLMWYTQPQNKFDIPMITFETNPIMGYFAMEGSRGQKTFCRDGDTGKIETIDNDPADTGVPQVGEAASDATKKGFKADTMQVGDGTSVAAFKDLDDVCASGLIYTQPCKRPNQKEETARENREVRRFHNTRATAVVPGVPGLIPQQLCEIVNVGKVFGGCYRIMKTIHTIGTGYTVKVDMIRASSTGTKDGTAATSDRANCQPVDNNQQGGAFVGPVPGDDATASASDCTSDNTPTGPAPQPAQAPT
jgi:hypothetical protein